MQTTPIPSTILQSAETLHQRVETETADMTLPQYDDYIDALFYYENPEDHGIND